MTARPMTEGERAVHAIQKQINDAVDYLDADAPRFARAILNDIDLRPLLSTSAAVRGMREALEHVIRVYFDGGNVTRADIEYYVAALSLIEGEDEQARSPSALSAPISTDTKGTTK